MDDATAPPAEFAELKGRIDAGMSRALEAPLARLKDRSGILGPVADELAAFTAEGKRLRPALLLLGFRAAGGTDLDAVDGPALALELLHTCALMHDDVIDRAATRRGRPTVHVSFAERHRAAGWRGSSAAYGEAMAILIGDLAFVQADELFLEAVVPNAALLSAFRRFTALREEVMVGQTLDLHAATAGTTDREVALTIATLKSGRYSVARPLEVGRSSPAPRNGSWRDSAGSVTRWGVRSRFGTTCSACSAMRTRWASPPRRTSPRASGPSWSPRRTHAPTTTGVPSWTATSATLPSPATPLPASGI
jgi:hypothetical protein